MEMGGPHIKEEQQIYCGLCFAMELTILGRGTDWSPRTKWRKTVEEECKLIEKEDFIAPSKQWKYISSKENSTNFVSRGLIIDLSESSFNVLYLLLLTNSKWSEGLQSITYYISK